MMNAVYQARQTTARFVLAVMLLLVLSAGRAFAHEGPPFPILVDQRVGPYVVSVWSDPDIGTGTFFVVIEPSEGGALAPVHSVTVGVAPKSGRLAEVVYEAEAQDVRYGARYYAEVQFDRGEFWNVRIDIDGAEGGGALNAEVEATPDGTIGPIGLVLYLFPFVAVGFLWIKAMRRQRQRRTALAQAEQEATT